MKNTRLITKLRSSFDTFIQVEASSSIVLALCTTLAFIAANSILAQDYHHFWHNERLLGFSYEHIVNDALMAVFFFVVGLEIKREFLFGELSDFKRASLPIFGAVGGMIVPALIFVLCNNSSETIGGWGIPMATDIAFAVGVVSLLGKRVPPALKVFLLALAIVDDIGAILVIAFFFTTTISWVMIAASFVLLLVLFAGNKKGIRNIHFYWVLGIVTWYLFFCSGVHATIAGVLVAFTVPAATNHPTIADAPLARFENGLHNIVAYGIIPLFALANAGVSVSHTDLSASISSPLSVGILLGLCIGKPLGITLFAWIASKARMASLPEGIRWTELACISVLGGIGFTMSLFIANLAFTDRIHVDEAKLAIMLASLVSGIVGFLLLRTQRKA